MIATLSRRTHTSLFQDAVKMDWKERKIPLSLYRVESIEPSVMGVKFGLLSWVAPPKLGLFSNKTINLL